MPQQPTPTGPTSLELKMRDIALSCVAQHGWPTTEFGLNRLIHAVQSALPRIRPSDREAPGPKVPQGVRARAEALAGGRFAAEKDSARPCDGPELVPVPSGLSSQESGPQALADDPVALDVLRLLVAGLTNPQIATQLRLTEPQVRHRVRRWMRVCDQHTRLALGVWARQAGILGGAEVNR